MELKINSNCDILDISRNNCSANKPWTLTSAVLLIAAYLSLVSIWRVRQEAGVDVFQVWTTGADGGDAQGVTAVSPTTLVRSEVWVVKGLGMRARGATAAGLCQLPAVRKWEDEAVLSFADLNWSRFGTESSFFTPTLTRSSVSWCLHSSWLWGCCWPTLTEAQSRTTGCSCRDRKSDRTIIILSSCQLWWHCAHERSRYNA